MRLRRRAKDKQIFLFCYFRLNRRKRTEKRSRKIKIKKTKGSRMTRNTFVAGGGGFKSLKFNRQWSLLRLLKVENVGK